MMGHTPDKVVRFMFTAYEKISADLKLRLRNDNLTQTSFFAGIVKLYLENDIDMMKVIYKVKENAKVMGKRKLSRAVAKLRREKSRLSTIVIEAQTKQKRAEKARSAEAATV